MRKFKLTPLLAALAAAVSVNAFAADASEDSANYPTMREITASIQAAYNTNNTLVDGVANTKEAFSRKYQVWQNQINAPLANQMGVGDGSGVVVGVVDTGVYLNHASLIGQVSSSYNYYNGGAALTGLKTDDKLAHGTMVSGIIAGTYGTNGVVNGIAPGSKIAMFRAFDTTSSVSNSIIEQGINWAVNTQRVPILNLSLGSTSNTFGTVMYNAVSKGTLVVAAMGNSGTRGAMFPAQYAQASWANQQVIAVGGLDTNAKYRATFSNYDPALAQWVVFAPGQKILSTYSTPTSSMDTASMNGSSFSAAMVSGQAALIKSNWNFLSANQVANIIFSTASRMCSNGGTGLASETTRPVTFCDTAGPDPIFGWGLINVAKSLQPIGTLYLPTTSGDIVTFSSGSKLNSGKGGTPAAISTLSTVALDNYKRGFYVDLGSQVSGTTTTTTSTPTTDTTTTTTTATGFALTSGYAYVNGQQSILGFNDDSKITLAKMAFGFTGKNGAGWNMGFGGTSDKFFGLQATGTTPLNLSGEGSKFNAPYYNFADRGNHAGYAVALNDSTVVRIGAMSQNAEAASAMVGVVGDVAQLSMTTVELQKKFGDSTVVMSTGSMFESNAALGMRGTGALALNATAKTDFVSFAGSTPIANNTYVSAMVSFGTTGEFKNNAASLINGISATESQAWSLGIAQKNVWKDGDSFGFTVAMPLRTTSGSMQVTTATQNQTDGSLNYTTQSVALAPSGMQKDLQLAYTRPAMFNGNVSAIAQAKLDPGHVAGAPTQYGIGIKYTKSF